MRKNLLFNLLFVLFAIFVLTNCSSVPKSFKEQALDDMYPVLTDEQFSEMKSLTGDNEITEFINTYWDSLEVSMKSNELRVIRIEIGICKQTLSRPPRLGKIR